MFVVSKDPLTELKEKIISGDKGDGIPNVLSPGDVFVREARQKPLTKGIKQKLLIEETINYDSDTAAGFSRNQTLIDLRCIPGEIKEKIINTYEDTKPAPRNKLLNYFIKNKLKNLMDVIEDF